MNILPTTRVSQFEKIRIPGPIWDLDDLSAKNILQKKGEKNPQTKMRGEKSPFWKESKTDEERLKQRKFNEYVQWRKSVYERDNYTCVKCKLVGITLNAHHIINYSDSIELRVDTDNGITLCEDCHKKFHKIYGKYNNNAEQLYEYLHNNH